VCVRQHDAHAVFGDEGDAVAFEGFAQQAQGAFVRRGLAGLEIAHRDQAQVGLVGKLLLGPSEKGTGGAAVFRADHAGRVALARAPAKTIA